MNDFRYYCAAALALCALAGQAGCALQAKWHWEKPGADDQQYTQDLNRCKAATYPADPTGTVTNESVHRMFACMAAKGWSRVAD